MTNADRKKCKPAGLRFASLPHFFADQHPTMGIKGLAKLLSDEAPEVSNIMMVCVGCDCFDFVIHRLYLMEVCAWSCGDTTRADFWRQNFDLNCRGLTNCLFGYATPCPTFISAPIVHQGGTSVVPSGAQDCHRCVDGHLPVPHRCAERRSGRRVDAAHERRG